MEGRGARRGAFPLIVPRPVDLTFQPGLFDAQAVSFDAEYQRMERITLEDGAWVDYLPGWIGGADLLFGQVLESRTWGQRTRKMYDKRVMEPRLTAPWSLRSGLPLEPVILDELRLCLSQRYRVLFDSIGFNLYRDGGDSVAWHGDRILEEIVEPIVALVSLGEPRKFLLRPRGGGSSRAWMLGRGDLLVTGGKTQRTWDHSVPKVARAGPRISLAFRYGLDPLAYGARKPVEPAS